MFAAISKIPTPFLTGGIAAGGIAYGSYSALTSQTPIIGLPFLAAGIVATAVTAYIYISQRSRRRNFDILINTGRLTGPYRRLSTRASPASLDAWLTATPDQRHRAVQISLQSLPDSQRASIHQTIVVRHAIAHFLDTTTGSQT